MRRFFWFVLSIALLVFSSAGAAFAQPAGRPPSPQAGEGDANAVLARLRESVNFARYDEALTGVRAYLLRTDLLASQRNAALEALAIVQIATRAENDARATLEQLYRRDPQHRLSDADASPRVQSAFARARDAHPAPLAVQLEQAPLDLRQRESPLVAVHIATGVDAVEEVRLAYRVAGDARFTRVVMALDQAVARARIPVAGDPSRALSIDYYVEAVAPSLIPLGNLGSESQPLVAQVPAARLPAAVQVTASTDPNARPNGWATGDGSGTPVAPVDEGSSVTSTWWFWTLIAVVVVGGAVGTYFAVTSGGDAPVGTLGTITLN